MKYNKLPPEIQERIKEIVRDNEKCEVRPNKSIENLFIWADAKEGRDFWSEINKGYTDIFYKRYPKYSLPEKWCIKINTQIGEWFEKQSNKECYTSYDYGYLHRYNGAGQDIMNKGTLFASFHDSGMREGYTEISEEIFYKYVLNNQIKGMKINTLTRRQLVEAYNQFSCEKWKDTLRSLLQKNWSSNDETVIIIDYSIIKLLIEEGTDEQKQYAKNLGIVMEDKNAFVKKFSHLHLNSVSSELFNDRFALQIADGMVEDISLKGRSLFVSSKYDVSLQEDTFEGTIIKIYKK